MSARSRTCALLLLISTVSSTSLLARSHRVLESRAETGAMGTPSDSPFPRDRSTLRSGAGVVRQVAELDEEQFQSSCSTLGLSTWGERAFLQFEGHCGGAEPWLSDGTTAGTQRILDLIPGDAGSDPQALGSAGGLLYFSADLPGLGRELWRTDGTPEGTLLLGDLEPGPRGSEPTPLAALEGSFYFSAATRVAGRELWRTDGTAAGTALVRDVVAGPRSGLPNRTDGELSPFAAAVGGYLLFAARDDDHGLELWRTDGTAGGTTLVLDIDAGPSGSRLAAFREGPGGVHFRAETPDAGAEPWISDGTAAGTRLLADIAPGPADSDPVVLGVAAGHLLFAAFEPTHGRELWRSDGTPEGTALWLDIRPGTVGSSLEPGASVAGVTVFAADDGVHGSEPWRSDGTPEGTHLLADLWPDPLQGSWHGGAAANDSWIFLIADVGFGDVALVRTDGTPANTQAGEPADGDSISRIVGPAAAEGRAIYTLCTDDCGPCQEFCSTFSSDGTSAGTQVLWPLEVHTGWAPARFRARSSDVVFTAFSGSRLYRTDGTAEGTVALERDGRFAYVRTELTPLPDGEVLFAAPDDDTNAFLWRTSADSFELVLGFYWYSSTVAGPQIFRLNASRYLFPVTHGQWNSELWRSDGTLAGTNLIFDFDAGNSYYAYPSDFVSLGGRAWFIVADDVYGHELWESDGTSAGTLVHELTPGPEPTQNRPTRLTPILLSDGPSLFYLFDGRLWRWNTQTQLANVVRRLRVGASVVEQRFVLAGASERALFFDLVAGGSCALFATDGSREGTERLLDVGAGARGTGTCPEELVRFRGHHYFAACGPISGCELWRTDGTSAGTTQVLEIEPGVISSSPSSLAAIGSYLHFAACTSEHGCEPWWSDGTAAGTEPLADLFPGPASSNPTGFAAAHGDVYFAANGGTGPEPWIFEPDALFADGFETGDTSRWNVPLRRARPSSPVARW